jgi:hypothetical protein
MNKFGLEERRKQVAREPGYYLKRYLSAPVGSRRLISAQAHDDATGECPVTPYGASV